MCLCLFVVVFIHILHIKQSRYALALCWRMLLRSRHSQRHKSLNRLAFPPLPVRSHVSNARRCCCRCRCVDSAKSISAQPSVFCFTLCHSFRCRAKKRPSWRRRLLSCCLKQAAIIIRHSHTQYVCKVRVHCLVFFFHFFIFGFCCVVIVIFMLCFCLFLCFMFCLCLCIVFVGSQCLGIFPHFGIRCHCDILEWQTRRVLRPVFNFVLFYIFFLFFHLRIYFSCCFLNSTSVDVTATAHKVYLS